MLAAATAAVVLAVVSPASAGNAAHTVHFSAHFTDPGSRITGIAGCPPGSFSLAGTAYFEAPLKATDTYTGCLSYDPLTQSVTGETFDKQTGFLAGCGHGSFVMHQTDLHSEPMPYDPSTNSARLTLRWSIVPGSGTGDFAGATGSGTGYADITPPTAGSFPGLPNSGVYSGSVSCPHHP